MFEKFLIKKIRNEKKIQIVFLANFNFSLF